MKIYRQDGSVDFYEDEHVVEEVIEIQPSSEEIKSQKLAEIEQLKAQLSESDYKVVKLAEALAIGGDMPYNAQALHAERQAIRDRINELEKVVNND